ncbi:MAG TPA: PilZ domain-containing protein [Hyphomicrobium sp.]|nr:PilZ domain-containing protein [Hyphomicrobium sp.]
MSTDATASGLLQRRQFGRREMSRAAHAMLPGGSAIACTVTNLSNAGALVEFAGAAVPTRSFRLNIEGAPYTLVCEIRHQGPSSVGVRFLNQTDGERLMAHLYPGPAISEETGDAPRDARGETPSSSVINSRDLRQMVLSSIADRADAERPVAVEPIHRRLPLQLWSSLTTLARKRPAADPVAMAISVPADEPLASMSRLPDDVAEVVVQAPAGLPDEAFRGYQPKRSRRNGIKGRSAGGIG